MKIFKICNIDNFENHYPVAGSTVSGLSVLSDIPNTSSISSSLNDYKILKGIREIPVSDLILDINTWFYSVEDFTSGDYLAQQIDYNKKIKPIIVVFSKSYSPEYPYLLEGKHRVYALKKLGITTIPALIVIDQED